MEITENKAKRVDKKGTVEQEVTFEDTHSKVKERVLRQGNKAVLTQIQEKKK